MHIGELAYDGELNKQITDCDFSISETRLALEYQRPADAAYHDATSSIVFANTIALTIASAHEDPREFARSLEPLIDHSAQKVQEAITIYREQGLSPTYGRPDRLLRLRVVASFVPAMISYRALCLYGDNAAAKELRLGHTQAARRAAIRGVRMAGRNKRLIHFSRVHGIMHEAATLAVLNTTSLAPDEDAIALPTFVADDDKRQADFVYITPGKEGDDTTLQYAQGKSRHKNSRPNPRHQVTIYGEDIGNIANERFNNRTNGILLDNDQSPEAQAHLAAHYDQTMAKIAQKSKKFPLVVYPALPYDLER